MRNPARHVCLWLATLCLAVPPTRAQADAATDAISRETTLFAPSEGEVSDAVARELSLWAPAPEAVTDAGAREVTLWAATPEAVTEANTREATLWIPAPDEPADAITRAFTSYVAPYVPADAVAALRIAAGLMAAGPGDAVRLNVVLSATPPDPVTLEDAARLLRLALKLDP